MTVRLRRETTMRLQWMANRLVNRGDHREKIFRDDRDRKRNCRGGEGWEAELHERAEDRLWSCFYCRVFAAGALPFGNRVKHSPVVVDSVSNLPATPSAALPLR